MISLIQYEARQVLRDPFSTKQGDGSGTSYQNQRQIFENLAIIE